MKIKRVPAKAVRIEIVPLLDMMTLLMVVFVYAASTMTVHRALPVELPAAAGGAADKPEGLAVTVDRAGRIFLEGRELGAEALFAEVKARLAERPDTRVSLDADRAAAYGEAVRALDALRRAGADKVRLSVREPAAASTP